MTGCATHALGSHGGAGAGDAETARAAKISAAAALMAAYPQTQLSAWYCGIKPNETTGLGWMYHSQVTSQKDVHCVAGSCSGEDVYADAPTVTAMVQALVDGCVPRHQ